MIECVSATGKAIAPLIIFKGKQHQESWYSNTNAADAFFAVSDQGWTNSEIALEWLQRDFDPQTKSQAQNGHQLLLINGYSSHTSYEFLEYCLQNKIIPFCMPSHSTHHLQPLDVSAFRLYQHYYSQAIDEESRLLHGVLNIGKHNFWCFFSGHVSRPSPYQQSALAGEKADSTHLILAWSTVFCLVIRLPSLERIAILSSGPKTPESSLCTEARETGDQGFNGLPSTTKLSEAF